MAPMPNIATALRAEIERISRKQIKTDIKALRQALTRSRSEIAALKRTVASLQKDVRKATRAAPRGAQAETLPTDASTVQRRFSPTRLAAHRKRLAISAESMGKLIGVSGASIHQWESGKTRPRAQFMPAIAALRTLTPKTAATVLLAR